MSRCGSSAGIRARASSFYEHAPPYRGIEVRGEARLEEAGDAIRDIAVRYLGERDGAAYTDSASDDTLIRLEPGRLRAWDFADQL
jgi:hypothetical protein